MEVRRAGASQCGAEGCRGVEGVVSDCCGDRGRGRTCGRTCTCGLGRIVLQHHCLPGPCRGDEAGALSEGDKKRNLRSQPHLGLSCRWLRTCASAASGSACESAFETTLGSRRCTGSSAPSKWRNHTCGGASEGDTRGAAPCGGEEGSLEEAEAEGSNQGEGEAVNEGGRRVFGGAWKCQSAVKSQKWVVEWMRGLRSAITQLERRTARTPRGPTADEKSPLL